MLPVPGDDVIFKRLSDGAVVYHCSEEIYFGLNEGGARVWELLPVSESLDDLVARIASENPDTEASTIRSDAETILARLEEYGLVRATAASTE